MAEEKTTEELLAEQLAFQKARGDFPDDEETDDEEQMAGSDEEDEDTSSDQSASGADDDDDNDSDEVDDESLAGEGDRQAASGSGETDAADDGIRGVTADDDDKSGLTIPKAVFDERNEKARQKLADLQARLDAAQQKLQVRVESADIDKLRGEISALEDKYEDHLVQGETTQAREVRKQLREKQEQLTETRLTQQSQFTGQATIEQIRFDTQLAAYEVKHSIINPDHEDFSQEVADEISDLISAFQRNGLTAVAALNKAVGYVIREAPESPKPKIDASVERDKRAARARRKVNDVQKKSPPDTGKAGKDSDKGGSRDGLPDITKMSIEQFDKLSEKELRELRGDRLE